jgi:hypothetical protein
MARHPLSFSTDFSGRGPGKRAAKTKPLDADIVRAVEESLADPRPNLTPQDVHDRLARRHEARMKRGP